ncbi:MAG: hypothetical protein AAF614_19425 [Chloroflexota bacterium]
MRMRLLNIIDLAWIGLGAGKRLNASQPLAPTLAGGWGLGLGSGCRVTVLPSP